jgi:protein gp37
VVVVMTGAYWDEVLNLAVGCDPVSAGCDYCFAPPAAWIRKSNPNEKVADAYAGITKRTHEGTQWTGRVNELPDRLAIPLRRRKPTTYYLTLMGDMFHKGVSDDHLARTFAMMAVTPRHTYLCTTKRHGRMRSLLNDPGFQNQVTLYAAGEMTTRGAQPWGGVWPLPNLRLAVSVENQATADLRIPALLDTPAAVRWISAEPLLGPIDLSQWLGGQAYPSTAGPYGGVGGQMITFAPPMLDWVVTGGESNSPRAVHPDHVRSLRDQCIAAGIPFWFKQWGHYRPVRVVDAPDLAGGRAIEHPRGGLLAAQIHERGKSGTMRNGTWRALQPGDRTRGGVMLDENTFAAKMGAKAAGRELDGRTWDEMPRTVDRAVA